MSANAKQLLREKARRDRFLEAVELAAGSLFDKQQAVYRSKSKRLCLRAGRRGGKTSTALPLALRAAAKFPGSIIPVCERTLTCAASMAFWKALQAFDAEHKLGIEFRHTVKEATMPNGSRIQLFGVDTLELADKLRGEPYPVVIIDEAGTFRSHVLEYLVDEVLKASLADYDGQLVIVGTPGPRKDPKNYWYQVCHNPQYEQHHWTLLDNPELGKQKYQRSREWREKWLAELALESGWIGQEHRDKPPAEIISICQHPKFRREFLGEWCDAFIDRFYEFSAFNIVDRLPPADAKRPWRYGLGIDLGFNDPTAFTITAARRGDPNIYVVDSMQKEGMIPSACAAQIMRYELIYGKFLFIVADTGGSGKLATEEMNQKFGLNILPAKKTGKMVYREHINGDFRTGRLRIVRGSNQDLIADLDQLRLNDAGDDAHPDDADHLPDSLLYNHRQWTAWNQANGFDGKEQHLIPGSAAWVAWQDELEEQRADGFAAAQEKAEKRAAGKIDYDPEWDLDGTNG